MKVSIFEGKEQIVIKDGVKPEIKTDEVLIQVKKVGICGSDVGSYESGGPYLPGKIIGHEFSGELVEIGENVKTSKNKSNEQYYNVSRNKKSKGSRCAAKTQSGVEILCRTCKWKAGWYQPRNSER